MTSRLYPDQHLALGASLTSNNGHSTLIMQSDGNLVLYRSDGSAPWASMTSNSSVKHAYMKADGDLVIYANTGDIWSSGTAGHPGAWLDLQDDGNLVIYSQGENGRPLWQSATATLLPADDELFLEILEARNSAPIDDGLLKKAYTHGADGYFRDLATMSHEVKQFLTALESDDASTYKKVGKNYTISLEVRPVKEERIINGKLYSGVAYATVSVDFDTSSSETVRLTFLSLKIAFGAAAGTATGAGLAAGIAAFVLKKTIDSITRAATVAAATAAAGQALMTKARILGRVLTIARAAGSVLAVVGLVASVVSVTAFIFEAVAQNISLGVRVINLTNYAVKWSFADLGYANCISATLASNKEIAEKDVAGEISPIDDTKAQYSYADASMANKNNLTGLAFSMKFLFVNTATNKTEHSCSVAFDLPHYWDFNNSIYGEFGEITDYHAFFEKMRGKYQFLKQTITNATTDPTIAMDLLYDHLKGDHPKMVGDDKKGRNYNCLVVFRDPRRPGPVG